MAAPFTEKVLQYPSEDFPFLPQVRDILGAQDPGRPLSDVHSSEEAASIGKRLRMQGGMMQHPGFREVYHRFVREFVRPHLGEDFVIFEHSPNLRLHRARSPSLTAPHKDMDHKHSAYELNFWLPLTRAFGTASLWAESSPGLGDFHPFEADYGEVVRFYGNQCMHFTKSNDTESTRVSFDFRVVRLRDFPRSEIVTPREDPGARWTLFSYYDVMGPKGLVSQEEWSGVLASLQAPLPQELAPAPQFAGRRAGGPRSPTPEHQKRCTALWGSERLARSHCARCGWIANRARLRGKLRFQLPGGGELPWIAESATKPWGLGCLLCSAARQAGLENVPRNNFSELTFGTGTPGLMCGPLFRHGNHAKRQYSEGEEMAIIGFDGGHEAAERALREGAFSLAELPPHVLPAAEN